MNFNPAKGECIYSLFFEILDEIDPELAKKLHDSTSSKPFTVSPLQAKYVRREGELFIPKGYRCWFRFTLLDDFIFQQMIRYFLRSEVNIELEGKKFQIDEVVSAPVDKIPWSGYSDWELLYEQAEPHQKIRLKFFSPTTFRKKDINYLLPDPQLVFGNLLSRWNNFSKIKMEEELEDFIAERIIVSRITGLRTKTMHFFNGIQIGFIGECEFEIRKAESDKEWSKRINTLADFAFYSGVGYKTTMGMGQTRRIRMRNTPIGVKRNE